MPINVRYIGILEQYQIYQFDLETLCVSDLDHLVLRDHVLSCESLQQELAQAIVSALVESNHPLHCLLHPGRQLVSSLVPLHSDGLTNIGCQSDREAAIHRNQGQLGLLIQISPNVPACPHCAVGLSDILRKYRDYGDP